MAEKTGLTGAGNFFQLTGDFGSAGVLKGIKRGKKRKRAKKRAREAKQRALLEQIRSQNRLSGEVARAQLEKGMQAQLGAYDQAIEKSSSQSRAARREAVTQAAKQQSELVQRYGAGGAYGTTALDQARQGVQSSLTRDLESIDAGFSGLFGNLAIGRGQAEAEGRAELGQLALDQGAQEGDILRMLYGRASAPQKPGALANILGVVGGAVGGIYGGPAGGAVGGALGQGIGDLF